MSTLTAYIRTEPIDTSFLAWWQALAQRVIDAFSASNTEPQIAAELRRVAQRYRATQPSYADDLLAAAMAAEAAAR